MALARDQTTSCSFYGNFLEPTSSSSQFQHMICPNSGFNYVYNERQDGNRLDESCKLMTSNSSPLSCSSSGNSSNTGFPIIPETNYQTDHMLEIETDHSLIDFKTGYLSNLLHSDASNFLSFSHLLDEVNCLKTTNGDYQDQWMYVEASIGDHPARPQESGAQQTCSTKRPHSEEDNMQAPKKQCRTSSFKKRAKSMSSGSTTSKDPQSVAAKNRRERISERLKILQDLVPNGSKVDLVTMLEKAIGYVKFLQLQVKVLTTDELWPAAGTSKAPDMSQVREAIDAILSSQRSEKATSSSSD